MIDELLEKFEDVFQPLDKEELDKRLFPSILHDIQHWAGDEITEKQLRDIFWAIAMETGLEDRVLKYVNELKDDYDREFRETHPEDIDDID